MREAGGMDGSRKVFRVLCGGGKRESAKSTPLIYLLKPLETCHGNWKWGTGIRNANHPKKQN